MSAERGIRWWPAVLVVLVATLAWATIWFGQGDDRQSRVTKSMAVALVAGVLLLAWLLLLSRMHGRSKILSAGALALIGVALGVSVRVRGVSGDVLPVLEWRWSQSAPLPEVARSAPTGRVRARPDDYPQFLGPDRTGVLPERAFSTDWDDSAPVIVWRQPIGPGWSAFAVVADRAVTQEQRDGDEWVTCYDAASGALAWAHVLGPSWDDPLGGPGPRATPTVSDATVYVLGGRGILAALDLATGEPRWTVDLTVDAGVAPPEYGFAGSPLVLGEAVIVAAGGRDGEALVAYDRGTGSRLWSGGRRPAGYSSPRAVALGGVLQVILFDGEGVTAHDPSDGSELWHVAWHGDTQHASQPVVLPGDRVYQSSGYGVGGRLFRVTRDPESGFRVDELWDSRGLKAKFTNVVHRDGFLYGLDDGILACLDVETGERRWKGGRYGHGQVLLVDDVLVVQSEKGFVAVVEASSESFREIARTDALDGKTWNHPALAGRRLFVRNDREAARIDLPPRAATKN